ncbi:hypothetical protein ACFY5D_03620 [Paeniglutamicibacter sp. NPDC012692]|uniref:hypothetical protein n=1 Tax=Paeniglutamicibacter sp. NPDC012692 TaxID=3364388 RepID=UPI0036B4AF99
MQLPQLHALLTAAWSAVARGVARAHVLCRLSPPSRLFRQDVAGSPVSDGFWPPKWLNRQYLAYDLVRPHAERGLRSSAWRTYRLVGLTLWQFNKGEVLKDVKEFTPGIVPCQLCGNLLHYVLMPIGPKAYGALECHEVMCLNSSCGNFWLQLAPASLSVAELAARDQSYAELRARVLAKHLELSAAY